MNNKSKSPAIGIICCLMAIVVVGVLAYAFLRESPSGEVPAETERGTETIVVTESEPPDTDTTVPEDDTIETEKSPIEPPDIPSRPMPGGEGTTDAVEEKADLELNVGDIKLNPDPTVLGSTVEYETKEGA